MLIRLKMEIVTLLNLNYLNIEQLVLSFFYALGLGYLRQLTRDSYSKNYL